MLDRLVGSDFWLSSWTMMFLGRENCILGGTGTWLVVQKVVSFCSR